MLNDAKASHNKVHAFGSEPCRLFHVVFYRAFFNNVFKVKLLLVGLPYMGKPVCAHSAVPAPSPALLRHRCSLLHGLLSGLCS